MNLCAVQKIKATVLLSGGRIPAEFICQAAENPVASLEEQLPFRVVCI